MSRKTESVAVLDPSLDDLDRLRDEAEAELRAATARKDAAEKAAAKQRAEQRAALLRDPAERRRRLAVLEQRKQEETALQNAIKQLEAEILDPSQALADLETGTVEEQVKKLRAWIVDPPSKRLERLKEQRKQLPAIEPLWLAFLECCPCVARLLEDLKREGTKQLRGTQEGRQQDRDTARLKLKDLSAALALNDDGEAIILLEEDPARLAALRRKYDLDPPPGPGPTPPVAEMSEAMSRENTVALLRR
jgi:hypothetical protein